MSALLLVRIRKAHVDDASNTVPGVHVVKALVDVLQSLMVRDKLVDPEVAFEIVLDDAWDL
jgi:hypothetical protein